MDTVSAHVPIRLDENLPSWERQPGESQTNYHAFSIYRALKPSERLANGHHHVANQTGRRPATIAKTARHYRWDQRAAAHDQHLATIDAHTTTETARAAHERNIRIVDRLSTVAEEIAHTLDPTEFTPATAIKYLHLVMTWRTALYGHAPTKVEVTGSINGAIDHTLTGSVDHTVQRWIDMPPADRDAEIHQLTDDVVRKRDLLATELPDSDESSDTTPTPDHDGHAITADRDTPDSGNVTDSIPSVR